MSAPGPPLRIAVLGAGTIGKEHAAAAIGLGHRVVAGSATSEASPRWRAFRAVAPHARFERNPEDLLEAPDVDAVVAALPWDVMEQWLPRLLSTPKAVLLEKPIALSAASVRRATQSPGAVLANKFVGYNRRFYSPVGELRKRLRTGGLKAAEITISETVERLASRYGPGIVPHVLVYSSCHTLDLALHLFGPLTPIRIRSHRDAGYADSFQSFNGLLETTGGIPVAMAINADAAVAMGVRCYFSDRTVWHLSPLERLVIYRGYQVLEPGPESRIRRYVPQAIREVDVAGEGKPGLTEQMRAFTSGEGQQIAATVPQAIQLLEFLECLQRGATPMDEGAA